MKKILNKFKVAIEGVFSGSKDCAIRTQFILAFFALLFGFLLKLDSMEWIVVLICIGSVITAEMFNTCIERLCDRFTLELDPQIKYIKDLAAGAVLVISITAFIVSMVILFRHF